MFQIKVERSYLYLLWHAPIFFVQQAVLEETAKFDLSFVQCSDYIGQTQIKIKLTLLTIFSAPPGTKFNQNGHNLIYMHSLYVLCAKNK